MINKFQLKNGLNVLLSESHRAPVVSAQLWVNTGSAHENKGERGISHFIEHLVFKGTEKFKVGEISNLIEGSGGELNAYTSLDRTVFHITISSHFLDMSLMVLSEMCGFPLFDEKEIDLEREVVIEEIRRGRDYFGRIASENLFKLLFKKNHYRYPIIGNEENIRKFSRKKILDYFRSRYTPNNMFLVLAGDFNREKARKKIIENFERIPNQRLDRRKKIIEPKQTKERFVIQKTEFQKSMAYFGWKTPEVNHKDIPVMDVFSILLGQGESSRLVHQLRVMAPLVNSIGSSQYSLKDDGLFTISMIYNKENIKKALAELTLVLKDFFSKGITQEELNKAIRNMENSEYYVVETVDGLSTKIGRSEFYYKDPEYFQKYIKIIRNINEQMIYKTAYKYLCPTNLSLSVVSQDEISEEKKLFRAWIKEWKKVYHSISLIKTNAIKPKVVPINIPVSSKRQNAPTKVQLQSGATALLYVIRDNPVFTLKSVMRGGLSAEIPYPGGLVELFGRTWMGGSKNHSEAEINEQIESLASNIYPVTGMNLVSLTASTLKPFSKKVSELFFDILEGPLFLNDVIEREKFIQIDHINTQKDNSAQICHQRFMEGMFKKHIYGRDPLGNLDSLKEVNAEKIRSYYESIFQASNISFVLCGNFEEQRWIEQLERFTSKMNKGKRFQFSEMSTKEAGNVHVFEKIKKEQTQMIYGYRTNGVGSSDQYGLYLLEAILGGQGGRLFSELRDKRSMAYSVYPTRMAVSGGGYFGAYIASSPDKAARAIELIKLEFNRLIQDKVTEEELVRAKRYVIGQHDIEMQKSNSIASAIVTKEIFDLDYLEPFLLHERIMHVQADDLLEISRKYFQQPYVLSMVGESNPAPL